MYMHVRIHGQKKEERTKEGEKIAMRARLIWLAQRRSALQPSPLRTLWSHTKIYRDKDTNQKNKYELYKCLNKNSYNKITKLFS